MFKAMGLNLGNFFIKKPLRWAFSQAFGSKMKDWFDNNLAVVLDAALLSGVFDPTSAIVKFVDNTDFINKTMNDVIKELKIPKQYQPIATDYIKDRIKDQIKKTFEDAATNSN
jgi:hypothetical protein